MALNSAVFSYNTENLNTQIYHLHQNSHTLTPNPKRIIHYIRYKKKSTKNRLDWTFHHFICFYYQQTKDSF